MPLPEVIELAPLDRPIEAEVTVPGSKSITNRALVLAALAQGETRLDGALWSEDTQVMVECLTALGFEIAVHADSAEASNRAITVQGLGGRIPRGGSADRPLELFVGNAGTAARFLSALVCLGSGCYRLHGTARMEQRPQHALFEALRALGYPVSSPNDRLPAVIQGGGPRPGQCSVSIEESSQFASALLLGAGVGGWRVEVVGDHPDESPYVRMTEALIRVFPHQGGQFQIEPDASSGSYFWAARELQLNRFRVGGGIRIAHWPDSGWQIDAAFPSRLPLPANLSRQSDLGDSIMTAIVLAPFASHPVLFTDLGRLRLQECERVAALRTELTRCGASVIEDGDTLRVWPSSLHGAEIETYNDHRMAMCFAIMGLAVAGMRIRNPACVAKTFPDFFAKLAAPPPHGLGVRMEAAGSGRRLTPDELRAA